MRTTVTLDSDVEHLVRRRMSTHKVSFKRALNDMLRETSPAEFGIKPYKTQTWAMGSPTISVVKALQLSAQLEDDELLRRMETGQ